MSIASNLGTSAPPAAGGLLLNQGSTSNNNNTARTNNSTTSKNKGRLRLTVLSAYDLPDREPPSYVQLDLYRSSSNDVDDNHHRNTEANDNNNTAPRHKTKTIRTGPPVQRHKDRNSFKFHSHHRSTSATTTSRGELVVETSTLAELYKETAVLTVVYSDPHKPQYSSSYPLNQLLIHETTWLILNLSPSSSENTTNTSTDPQRSGTTSPSPLQQQPQQLLTRPSTNGSLEDVEDEIPPTLRLQMTLEGPYRSEIAALVHLVQAWLSLVDDVESRLGRIVGPYMPPVQWLLVPTAPIVAMALVSTPVVVGICVVTLPFILPVLVLGVIVASSLVGLGTVVYASTKVGRTHVAGLLSPLHHALLHTHSGQEWIYQTGPRPTPVHLLRSTVVPGGMWGQLVWSLGIDFVGSSSYLLPLVGEGLDIVWAPLQTALIMALYCPDPHETDAPTRTKRQSAGWLPYLSFLEEILPFTDIVPTATIGWLGDHAWPLLFPGNHNHSFMEQEDTAANTRMVVTATHRNAANTTTTTKNTAPIVVPNHSLRESVQPSS